MIALLLLAAIALFVFYEIHWKRRKYPPGPTPLPIIGNAIPVSRRFPAISLYKEWAKEYGPIFTYWIGSFPIITINDYSLIQEMFVKDGDSYADRGQFADISEFYRGGSYGIVDTNGRLWREQRRFTLHTLRDLGAGKEAMQHTILEETADLLDTLESLEGTALNPLAFVEKSVASIINRTIFGFRFDKNREGDFHRLNRLLKLQTEALASPILLLILGHLKIASHIPIVSGYLTRIIEARDALWAYLQENIDEHVNHVDYSNDEVDDFCEAYLKEMHRQRNDPDTTFSGRQLLNVCADLWLAGQETTSTTIQWGIVALLKHPEVLTKLHAEYDVVIGSDRLITSKDRSSLPYANAFISEVQRWANIIPLNAIRRAARDVTIGGTRIAAGTPVCPQISVVMANDTVFPDPDAFNPDRFIDSSGQFITYKELMPFSVGKRKCPGESIAKTELFIILANLTHRFNVVGTGAPISTVKRLKNNGKPDAFDCIFTRRLTA